MFYHLYLFETMDLIEGSRVVKLYFISILNEDMKTYLFFIDNMYIQV